MSSLEGMQAKGRLQMEPPADPELRRFVVELEFVQCLANFGYLHFLAQRRYLEDESFVAYLRYLRYLPWPLRAGGWAASRRCRCRTCCRPRRASPGLPRPTTTC